MLKLAMIILILSQCYLIGQALLYPIPLTKLYHFHSVIILYHLNYVKNYLRVIHRNIFELMSNILLDNWTQLWYHNTVHFADEYTLRIRIICIVWTRCIAHGAILVASWSIEPFSISEPF